jgi:hypothetical protein
MRRKNKDEQVQINVINIRQKKTTSLLFFSSLANISIDKKRL